MESKQRFDELGVKVVAIGHGNMMFAKKFKEVLPWDGEVYVDEKSETFKALNLKRPTMWGALKRYAAYASLFKKAMSKHKDADNTSGLIDGLQTGGVFVIDGTDEDKMVYSFVEHDNPPDTFANIDEMIRACGGPASSSEPSELDKISSKVEEAPAAV